MSEEIKEYPFDVKFDESALKTFNDLIKEKGIRHFKLESDLYGILDVVSYEEYEKLQQKVEQLENTNDKISSALNNGEKEIERLNNIINELEKYLEEFDFTVFICCNRKASKSIELGARLNNDFILDKLKELKDSDNNVKKINTNNN